MFILRGKHLTTSPVWQPDFAPQITLHAFRTSTYLPARFLSITCTYAMLKCHIIVTFQSKNELVGLNTLFELDLTLFGV